MTGGSCLARAVVSHTAAAVAHADTELIGHDGQLETPGFFEVVLEAKTFIESILFYKANSRFFISLPFIFEFSL